MTGPINRESPAPAAPLWTPPRKPFVIFDLDGTLADVRHRRHNVENGRKDWDAFYAACVDDTPMEGVAALFRTCRAYGRYDTIILSGRSDVVQSETEDWLFQHGLQPKVLRMRPAGNRITDDELKERFLLELFGSVKKALELVEFVVDDRNKMVAMWRRLGFTCLQPEYGDF